MQCKHLKFSFGAWFALIVAIAMSALPLAAFLASTSCAPSATDVSFGRHPAE
jgi:hypothetical protein